MKYFSGQWRLCLHVTLSLAVLEMCISYIAESCIDVCRYVCNIHTVRFWFNEINNTYITIDEDLKRCYLSLWQMKKIKKRKKSKRERRRKLGRTVLLYIRNMKKNAKIFLKVFLRFLYLWYVHTHIYSFLKFENPFGVKVSPNLQIHRPQAISQPCIFY